MNNRTAHELYAPLVLAGSIWVVFLVDLVLPAELTAYGLVPRTAWGLLGIVTMPFLHAGWPHLISNTVPLIVLLTLLIGSRARSWQIVVDVTLAGGGLLWLFGRSADHVGASGLIFGMIGFLLVSGFRERRLVPLAVSLVVAFLYGGTLLSGVMPRWGSRISWDGHLWGAVGGGLVGLLLTRSESQLPPQPPSPRSPA